MPVIIPQYRNSRPLPRAAAGERHKNPLLVTRNGDAKRRTGKVNLERSRVLSLSAGGKNQEGNQ